ncbi:MAG: GDSL-type esterase/lipase family protein [Candidatus Rokuibacteriota bacterium]
MPAARRPLGPGRRRAPAWRRPVLAAALALLGLAAYAWWSGGDAPLPPLDPTRDVVVFLGDSITGGHGLPLEVTFPHRLGAALGIRIRNAGISGDTTAGALQRLGADVLAHRPKLVVVELGANDAFRRVPSAQVLQNLRAIVRRVRESGSGVVLIHVRVAALGSDLPRDGLREIAREEGARLVEDFLAGVVPSLTNDGLHPTAEGHARLAAHLEPILRELLTR